MSQANLLALKPKAGFQYIVHTFCGLWQPHQGHLPAAPCRGFCSAQTAGENSKQRALTVIQTFHPRPDDFPQIQGSPALWRHSALSGAPNAGTFYCHSRRVRQTQRQVSQTSWRRCSSTNIDKAFCANGGSTRKRNAAALRLGSPLSKIAGGCVSALTARTSTLAYLPV